MKVSADQVASIRALLTRDIQGYERISERLDQPNKNARGALIAAAFCLAGRRRFKGCELPDVRAFVDDLRFGRGVKDEIDPCIAERLLLATFTSEAIDDIDDDTQGGHFGILLAGLVADAQLDDSQLDAFLADAKKLADEWLAEL